MPWRHSRWAQKIKNKWLGGFYANSGVLSLPTKDKNFAWWNMCVEHLIMASSLTHSSFSKKPATQHEPEKPTWSRWCTNLENHLSASKTDRILLGTDESLSHPRKQLKPPSSSWEFAKTCHAGMMPKVWSDSLVKEGGMVAHTCKPTPGKADTSGFLGLVDQSAQHY